MYTIKRAAELVGVSESALRSWERRYRLKVAKRNSAGYRLYDDEALRILHNMNQLLQDGWAGEAAANAARNQHQPLLANSDIDPVAQLVQVTKNHDSETLTALLDQQFGSAAFENMVDNWMLPAMSEIGRAWTKGEVDIAGEHLVTHSIMRRLSAVYDQVGDNPNSPRVVLGLPANSFHDLALLAFAVCLRRVGLATTFLGANVPPEAWASAIKAKSVAAVVISLPRAEDVEGVNKTIDLIHKERPGLFVAVGGAAQELVKNDNVQLGHRLGPAASEMRRKLVSN